MMIKKILATAIFFIMALCELSAQESHLGAIKEKFDNFEYNKVIVIADSLLSKSGSLSRDEVSELLRMKAISQYSLSDTKGAGESFREILKISPEFSLDSLDNSPKIISFFNDIKSSYRPLTTTETKKNDQSADKSEIQPEKKPEIKPDNKSEVSSSSASSIYLTEYNYKLKNSLLRSIILPGWGHLYSGNTTKGWVLSTAGAASLSSLIYFIVDSGQKEKNYLNERDPLLISDKYDKYNASNRMKYISLSTYALVWLYSQVDILFFSDGLFKTEITLRPEQISRNAASNQVLISLTVPLR